MYTVILGGHPSFKLKISGINVFINKFDDDGAWLGTFEGYSFDDGSLIVHKSGYILFKSTVSFESPVVVDGQEYEGGLEMRINGWLPVGADYSEYEGTWVITRATGDLRGLTGRGTWDMTGADCPILGYLMRELSAIKLNREQSQVNRARSRTGFT